MKSFLEALNNLWPDFEFELHKNGRISVKEKMPKEEIKEITLAVDFHPMAVNGCKFHIESRKEIDGGWEITGWWTEIDLAGRLLGLKLNVPTTLTIMVGDEK